MQISVNDPFWLVEEFTEASSSEPSRDSQQVFTLHQACRFQRPVRSRLPAGGRVQTPRWNWRPAPATSDGQC